MTSDHDFKVTTFLKHNIRKTAHLKYKVTIAQEETIPNIWNGTMFGDLDWPLNATRGFVSISWASCLPCYRLWCIMYNVNWTIQNTIKFMLNIAAYFLNFVGYWLKIAQFYFTYVIHTRIFFTVFLCLTGLSIRWWYHVKERYNDGEDCIDKANSTTLWVLFLRRYGAERLTVSVCNN